MFNFGISKDSAVRTTRPQLKPWNIYDVKLVGWEISEGTSKNDPSKSWKRLDVKFENEDGYFNVPLWYPKDGDNERRSTVGKNGGVIAFASNFETLMATVAQIAQVLNPSGFEKMQAASSKFKSFDDVVKVFTQVLDKVKGAETKIKLVGSNYNGKVTTKIPNIVGISNSGEYSEVPVNERPSYISDNFIGNKLFFTEYEEHQREQFMKATPTAMPKETKEEVLNNDDDFDLDSLL